MKVVCGNSIAFRKRQLLYLHNIKTYFEYIYWDHSKYYIC